MSTQALFGQLLIGLINGSFYALLSLGLAVIFGLLNIINFSHGAQYMMGAFVAYFLLNKLGLGYWWALLIVPFVVGAFGMLIERLMLSRLYKLDHLYGLLLTFGLALIIEGAFHHQFGSAGLPYSIPESLQGSQNLGFMFLPYYRGWVIFASAAICLATWFVIERTKLGAYIRAWGVREIVELDWWQEASIGSLRVTATPARHMSARRLGDRNQTLWCGFALEVGGTRVFFAGDTAYHPQFGEVGERCGPFDFVMIPIGAYEPRWFMQLVHVNPEEAVRIYQDLIAPHPDAWPPMMLAIHWGTFRLTTEPMDEPPRRVAARWREVGLDPSRLWLSRFGETRSLIV